MATRLPSLKEFNCDGDENSLRLRWLKWKRAFEIYLTAANITDEKEKLANLLHVAGIEFQDIFYSIPNVNEETVYQTAIKNLDQKFNPKHKSAIRKIFI